MTGVEATAAAAVAFVPTDLTEADRLDQDASPACRQSSANGSDPDASPSRSWQSGAASDQHLWRILGGTRTGAQNANRGNQQDGGGKRQVHKKTGHHETRSRHLQDSTPTQNNA